MSSLLDLDPKRFVASGENPEEFMKLVAEVEDRYHPTGPVERFHAETLISHTWRMRRFQQILPQVEATGNESAIKSWTKLASDCERGIRRAIKDLEKWQATRLKEERKAAPKELKPPRTQKKKAPKPQYPPLDDSLPPFYFIN